MFYVLILLIVILVALLGITLYQFYLTNLAARRKLELWEKGWQIKRVFDMDNERRGGDPYAYKSPRDLTWKSLDEAWYENKQADREFVRGNHYENYENKEDNKALRQMRSPK